MYEIGRICIKLAGRDSGRTAVIVDILDDRYVLIDGDVRRKKCNIIHLEPTGKVIEIEKNASHDSVAEAFKAAGFGVWQTSPKDKKEKPQRLRGKKEQEKKETKKKEKKVVKEAKIVEESKSEQAEKPKAKKPAKKKAEKTEDKEPVKKPAKKKAPASKED